ncbi:MAG: LysE/ArgO family amino acid transporter [Granulosicoccus sp.]|nr:LysE/ArgO family amino acid transporter [Granulosicoccus sp.]
MAYLGGFSLGFSLILAIGSQNAFVLKQGLRNHHIFIVCAICALSDAALILIGVGGFGVVVEKFPSIEIVARFGGAIFLTTYALLSFKSALMNNHSLQTNNISKPSLTKTVLMCLAFTWLNPHVYLDTVVLLGSVSVQYNPHQWLFAAGATTASFLFFFSLGYGARILAPVFENPIVWRYLEFIIGIIMLAIAASLVL